MAIARRLSDDSVEVIPPQRAVIYPTTLLPSVPDEPRHSIRRTGLLGLGENKQDAGHAYNLVAIRQAVVETEYAILGAVHAEVVALKAAADEMTEAERIVYSLPPGSAAEAVTADIASDLASRARVRTARLMDAYDAHVLNLRRR